MRKNIMLIFLLIIFFTIPGSCQLQPPTNSLNVEVTDTSKGYVSINIKWPDNNFQIKKIPDETQYLIIIISGENLTSNIVNVIQRPTFGELNFGLFNTTGQNVIIKVPPGNKNILVEARDKDSKLIASGIGSTNGAGSINITLNPKTLFAKINPPSGVRGTQFVRSGFGFTPNSKATVYSMKSETFLLLFLSQNFSNHSKKVDIDSYGNFKDSYISSSNDSPTTYVFWAVDDTTGKKTRILYYSISNKVVSVNPFSSIIPNFGNSGDTFTMSGTGYYPNANVTLNLKNPVSGSILSLSAKTDAEGNFSYTYKTSISNESGTYMGQGIDNVTNKESNEFLFQIISSTGGTGGGVGGGNSGPQVPHLSSPANSANLTSGDISFSWGTSSGAGRYHLMVCTDSSLNFGCVNPDGDMVGLEPGTNTSATVNLSTGTWYWAVRAICPNDSCGWGSYSQIRTLNVDEEQQGSPSAPSLSSPANGDNLTSGDINFSWETSSGAGRYHLMVCTDSSLNSGCVNPDGDMDGLEPDTDTSGTINLNTGTWYWAVRAICPNDSCSWGPYSSVRSLNVSQQQGSPSAPSLSSPANGDNYSPGNISFSWGTSSGAGRYHLMVCTSSSLTSGCVNPDGGMEGLEPGTNTSAIVNLSSGTWYWAVRAICPNDSCSWGSYSSVRSLNVVQSSPSAPSLSSPANGDNYSPGNISFSWGTSSGAGRYHLMVCTSSSLTSGCVNPDGGMEGLEPGTNTSAIVNLSSGTWYWAVRAICPNDSCSWGSYSSVRSLNVVQSSPSAPSLSSPANGDNYSPGNISFSWGTSSGAGRYHLMVCTSSSLTSGCVNPDGGMEGLEPGTNTSVTVNLSSGTWYWAVRAICPNDSCSWGPYSSIRSLNVVQSSPSAPSLSSPANGDNYSPGNISFSWGTSSGAGRYHLMVCTSSSLTSGCLNPDGGMEGLEPGTNTSATVNLSSGTWYWAVRAICPNDSCSWGPYSSIRSLNVVQSSPSAPSLSSPANGANFTPGNISFSWGTSSGAGRYHLMVCTSSSLTSGCLNPDGGMEGLEPGTNTSVTVNLSAGTWYWAVRAICPNDSCSWGSYSSVRSLSVVATGSLSGGVRNNNTNAPLNGATVRLTGNGQNLITTSNSSGVYTFNNVPIGSYTVTGSFSGYLDRSFNITINSGITTSQNIALTPM